MLIEDVRLELELEPEMMFLD